MAREQVDRQLWAVAGPYRRRRRLVVVLVPLLVLVPAVVFLVQAFRVGGEARVVRLVAADVCALLAGGISWALHSSWGRWALDRVPFASPASRLAHHVLRLHALMGEGRWVELCEIPPTAAAVAHAARRLGRTGVQGSIPQIAGGDLVEGAGKAAGDAGRALEEWLLRIIRATGATPSPDDTVRDHDSKGEEAGYHPAGHPAETLLALTRLAVLRPGRGSDGPRRGA